MALPSAVTVGSVVFVVAAGVGFVAVSSSADESEQAPTKQVSQSARQQPSHPDGKADKAVRSDDADRSDRPKAKQDKKDKKAKRKHERPDNAVPNVLVEVYNNSGISGLAGETSAVLEGAGWNVAVTDNWYGNIPDNTVYYPQGLDAEAKRLAKTLGITRMMPAVSPMQFDRLTVILTHA